MNEPIPMVTLKLSDSAMAIVIDSLTVRQREIEQQLADIKRLLDQLRPGPLFEQGQAPDNPEPEAKPQAKRAGRPGHSHLSDVIRQLAPSLPQPFRRGEMIEAIVAAHPEMKDQMNQVGYRLIELAQHGELIRDGVKSATTYRVGKINHEPAISEKERRYREFSQGIPRPVEE